MAQSITEWKAERARRKERAKATVAENAKKAEAAKKKALAKGAQLDNSLAKAAKPIEQRSQKRYNEKLEAQGKDGQRNPAEVKK